MRSARDLDTDIATASSLASKIRTGNASPEEIAWHRRSRITGCRVAKIFGRFAEAPPLASGGWQAVRFHWPTCSARSRQQPCCEVPSRRLCGSGETVGAASSELADALASKAQTRPEQRGATGQHRHCRSRRAGGRQAVVANGGPPGTGHRPSDPCPSTRSPSAATSMCSARRRWQSGVTWSSCAVPSRGALTSSTPSHLPDRDAGYVESTGRNPMTLNFTAIFRRGVVGEGGGRNAFPDNFFAFQAACADRTAGQLVHPILGTLKVVPVVPAERRPDASRRR